MSIPIPPFVGANVPDYMPAASRYAWYAIWITSHPMSTIHVRSSKGSFFIESSWNRV